MENLPPEDAVIDPQSYTTFETRLGFAAIAWDATGVIGLRLPAKTEAAAEAAMRKRLPKAARANPAPAMGILIENITRYFLGEKIDFSAVKVDLGPQNPFFSKVYAEVRKLGWGETTTYGAIAEVLGEAPQAARDVGRAMAANPVPLIVPCHRVLAAGGKIGGFSAPGGARSKAHMLRIEGLAIDSDAAAPAHEASKEQIGFEF